MRTLNSGVPRSRLCNSVSDSQQEQIVRSKISKLYVRDRRQLKSCFAILGTIKMQLRDPAALVSSLLTQLGLRYVTQKACLVLK